MPGEHGQAHGRGHSRIIIETRRSGELGFPLKALAAHPDVPRQSLVSWRCGSRWTDDGALTFVTYRGVLSHRPRSMK